MERKNQTSRRKKVEDKKNFSKIIVTAIIILNVSFTAAILYIFLKTSCEPTALVAAWFSFTTVEMWNLASIKKSENEKDEIEQ